MEYIAPFLSNVYFAILRIAFMVNFLTITAPNPFPIKMRGTAVVKAKAPMTPSMENEASKTSK